MCRFGCKDRIWSAHTVLCPRRVFLEKHGSHLVNSTEPNPFTFFHAKKTASEPEAGEDGSEAGDPDPEDGTSKV